jgi:hypothetical protein
MPSAGRFGCPPQKFLHLSPQGVFDGPAANKRCDVIVIGRDSFGQKRFYACEPRFPLFPL